MLRQNGFEIEADEEDVDMTSGKVRRLNLVAQPVSKSTVFDMKGALCIFSPRFWQRRFKQPQQI